MSTGPQTGPSSSAAWAKTNLAAILCSKVPSRAQRSSQTMFYTYAEIFALCSALLSSAGEWIFIWQRQKWVQSEFKAFALAIHVVVQATLCRHSYSNIWQSDNNLICVFNPSVPTGSAGQGRTYPLWWLKMIKLFSAVGNESPGCTKLLYTHYKMVAGINRKAQDVCLITDRPPISDALGNPKQTTKCQNLSSPRAPGPWMLNCVACRSIPPQRAVHCGWAFQQEVRVERWEARGERLSLARVAL